MANAKIFLNNGKTYIPGSHIAIYNAAMWLRQYQNIDMDIVIGEKFTDFFRCNLISLVFLKENDLQLEKEILNMMSMSEIFYFEFEEKEAFLFLLKWS